MTDLNDLSLGQSVSADAPDPTNKLTSEGRGINRDGVVVGYSHTNASAQSTGWAWHIVYDAPHAAKFNGATPIDLGITPSDAFASGEAEAINDNGAIVGYGNYYQEAFFQLNGQTQTIAPAPGANYAGGLNNLNHVVGSTGNSHAFLWVPTSNLPENERIIDLHALGSFSYSGADAINDRDQVVGSGNGSALLWQNGKVFQLNDLIGPHPSFYLTSARGINQSGMVVASTSGSSDAGEVFLLLPFHLTQSNYPTTKDTTDLGPTKEKAIGTDDVAYITGLPQMPQLEARIKNGAVSGLSVEWRMTVTSERVERGTKDDLTIPQAGVVELPINQPWRINDSFEPGSFFGGLCTIFYRLKAPAGYIDDERSLQFKIRGKNPKDSIVRAYIESTPGTHQFAWAMAQHESRSSHSNRVYNQFNSGGSQKELPNYSADQKNGWGLFQRDDTGNGIYVDTGQVYSWQINTQVFHQEMIQKQAAQQRFFDAVAAAHPNIPAAQSPPASFTFPGTTTAMTALEAGTITLYNGAKGCPQSTLGGITYKNPWKFDRSSRQWSYTANSENYLYKVIYDEVEQHLPVVE